MESFFLFLYTDSIKHREARKMNWDEDELLRECRRARRFNNIAFIVSMIFAGLVVVLLLSLDLRMHL